ncbi:MAG: nucleotide sugar dehydrogenase [Dehalococcoidia bacterium]|nr:nucleotide sugar dehydrogenase [Dehalococcoidia bacterium]
MSQSTQDLLDKLASARAVVGIVGVGYVGLPLAAAIAQAGFKVMAIDVDSKRINAIQEGRSYIEDVSSAVIAALRRPTNGAPRLEATTNFTALESCDVVFICVPTPFDEHKTPQLAYIELASQTLAKHLQPGQLVVLESTTYPGTTEELVRPILEGSGLRAGVDFYLAFSPERIDPGNTQWTVSSIPKVVGGITPVCAELAAAMLRKISPQVHVVSSPGAAEMTKLLENTFRSVNIALVNEMAMLCEHMGLNIWEVIEAASTKPFGFLPFYPGPGVGGHCIPVDPYYLAWKAREYDFQTKFIELAADTNQKMPQHVVELVVRALGAQGKSTVGAKVLLLGVAFKANVSDARNSPSDRVMAILLAQGAQVSYHDPFVPHFELAPSAFYRKHKTLESVPLTDEILAQQDCVVALVRHRNVDYDLVMRHAALVVDTVNACHAGDDGKVIRLGVGQSGESTTPRENDRRERRG